MIARIVFNPQPIELPNPPDNPIIAYVTRRARVTHAHAAVVVQLAGLGPREAR